MDKFPVGKIHNSPQAKLINTLCNKFDYVDIWRALHPSDKQFIFFSNPHKCHTRLDYFFTPKNVLQHVISGTIVNVVVSDHATVFLKFRMGGSQAQSRCWRFDTLILKDHKFISYFSVELKFFLSINCLHRSPIPAIGNNQNFCQRYY